MIAACAGVDSGTRDRISYAEDADESGRAILREFLAERNPCGYGSS